MGKSTWTRTEQTVDETMDLLQTCSAHILGLQPREKAAMLDDNTI